MSEPVWDVFAAASPNGAVLATLDSAFGRQIRIELDGPGSGSFKINRHASEATAAVLAQGNIVKCWHPDLGPDYIWAFVLEQGDFALLSPDEEGGEDLEFGGRGNMAYLDRARMWNAAYTTGMDVTPTWTEVWNVAKVEPTGVFYDPDDGYAYIVDRTTRREWKIDQATKTATVNSGALCAHAAGGLSLDPLNHANEWLLEAPWLVGSTAHCYIHQVRRSDHAILASFDIGTNTWTDIRADATDLWLTNWTDNKIYRKSTADGSTIASYSITYKGVAQLKPDAVSCNAGKLAYWFDGQKRALVADNSSAPLTITREIATTDISSYGGDWTNESGSDYFYMVSWAAGETWKFQVTDAVPHDPLSGIWRLDEGTPGAILARVVSEWQAGGRPQQPLPDLTYDFTNLVDSNGDAWETHAGTLEFDARVGDLGLDTVLRLLPFGVVVVMTPDFVLHAYNRSTYGVNRAAGEFETGKARFCPGDGGNIVDELRRSINGARIDTHMLALGADNISATATDADRGYVVEGFMSTDLKDAAALAGAATATLEQERVLDESTTFAVTEGDDQTNGRYLPLVHYAPGDTIRVHTGTGELDYNEQDFLLYGVTLDELDNGEWKPTLELGTAYFPSDSASSSGGSSGSTGGGGGGGSSPAALTVRDTATGKTVAATALESPDWTLTEPSDGVARVYARKPALAQLTDVDAADVADGDGLTWDAASGKWLPGTAGHTHVWNEAPSGVVNGTNGVFTLAMAPSPSSSLLLFRNGLLMLVGAGNDYTLSTNTITFQTGNEPAAGAVLVASYTT